jgi:hypothetical protein
MLEMQGIALTQLPVAAAGPVNGTTSNTTNTPAQQQQQQAGAGAWPSTGRRLLRQGRLLQDAEESRPEQWTLLVWGVTRYASACCLCRHLQQVTMAA